MGSAVRSVVDTKTGCKGCPTCVNLKTKKPTTVPVCFTEPSKCAMPMLQVREEKGQVMREKQEKQEKRERKERNKRTKSTESTESTENTENTENTDEREERTRERRHRHCTVSSLTPTPPSLPSFPLQCAKGSDPIVTPPGLHGAAPCCPSFKCVAKTPVVPPAVLCPEIMCEAPPRGCAKGSSVQTPILEGGCRGCPACLDEFTGKKTPVRVRRQQYEKKLNLNLTVVAGT